MTIVEQVSDLIGETGEAVYWPKEHIYDTINGALVLAWFETRNAITEGTMTATTSVVTTPSTVMVPTKVYTAAGEFPVSRLSDLERFNSDWRETEPGESSRLIPFDWDQVKPYPPPLTSTVFFVRGVSWPPEVSAGTETTGLDSTLDTAVAYLAASLLVEDSHPQLADGFYRNYQERRQEYMTGWRNRGNRLETLRPAGVGAKKFSGSMSNY